MSRTNSVLVENIHNKSLILFSFDNVFTVVWICNIEKGNEGEVEYTI